MSVKSVFERDFIAASSEPVCTMCNEPLEGLTMQQHRRLLCPMWPSLARQITILAEKLNDIEKMLDGEYREEVL